MEPVFVARRDDGSIYGVWAVRQVQGQEELPENHPDVVAFRAMQAAVIEKGLGRRMDKS